jgi:hypothetical protein
MIKQQLFYNCQALSFTDRNQVEKLILIKLRCLALSFSKGKVNLTAPLLKLRYWRKRGTDIFNRFLSTYGRTRPFSIVYPTS